MESDAEIVRFSFETGDHTATLDPEWIHSVYLINGEMKIQDETVSKDDFVVVKNENDFNFTAISPCDIFMISIPAQTGYPTYTELIQNRYFV
jgi:redox-sensitive bicupin YhaK (pirin superfamily)